MGCRVFVAVFVIISLSTAIGIAAQQTPWVAPDSASTVENPIEVSKKSVSEGKAIFDKQCVVCHGKSGKGNGPASKALGKTLPDFTKAEMNDKSDGELFWKISNGRAPMPAFKAILTDEERWQVIDFVRSFSAKDKG